MAQKKAEEPKEVEKPKAPEPAPAPKPAVVEAPTNDLEQRKKELIAKINAMSSVDQLANVIPAPAAPSGEEMKVKEQKVVMEKKENVGAVQLQIEVSSDLVQTKDEKHEDPVKIVTKDDKEGKNTPAKKEAEKKPAEKPKAANKAEKKAEAAKVESKPAEQKTNSTEQKPKSIEEQIAEVQDELESKPQAPSSDEGGFIGIHLKKLEQAQKDAAEERKRQADREARKSRSETLTEDEDEEAPAKKKGILERAEEKLQLMQKQEDKGLVEHAVKDPKYKREMKQIADIHGVPGIAHAADDETQEAVYQALME